MLFHELQVRGFRCFESFEVPELTRVNLLVGKNNAGKTTLLEAVEALALGSPRRHLSRRRWSDEPRPVEILRHLFHGRTFGRDIELRSGGAILRLESPSAEAVRRGEPHLRLIGPGGTDLLAPPWHTAMAGDDLSLRVPVWFVEPRGDVPEVWDQLVLTPEEDLVVEAMRILEPRLERIAFAGNYLFKLSGDPSRIPIASFGDGTHRLLNIAVALARSAGGVLLIDEIDTGLHHTTLEQLWRLVVQTARRLDVQVFATTHSGDCIRALAWLHEDDPELAADVSLHRIDLSQPRAVRYSAEELEIAAKHHIEVRG